MSITLSIPPAVVQEVGEWAEANGTSLNQYVRDFFEKHLSMAVIKEQLAGIVKDLGL